MNEQVYRRRLDKVSHHMQGTGLDVLLLTKPSNMFYLTGDGRLCAYTMITQDGKVALGVPVTDIEDVKALAYHDHLVGFNDEVGMIHSIAHYFEHFSISTGAVGLQIFAARSAREIQPQISRQHTICISKPNRARYV